ncbi:MAG: hypothetical protein ACTIKK_11455 [Agrococcus casei]|uniref:hypothetical protein n=1 Tax=Microbacteriaceae TaxID=85023 RepID=UPI003F9C4F6A
MVDDDEARTPEEMLALVRDQQRSIEGQKGAFVPLILLSWGIAWLVGFGALWLIDGLDGFALPIAVAAPIFVVLLAGAGVVSTVLGIRSTRGVRGGREDAFAGVIYGQLWWVGALAIFILGQGLVAGGMRSDVLGLFYPAAYLFFAGVMYVVGGIIWHAVPMLVLGAWSLVVAVLGPFAGRPALFLVYALAGGGGFLVVAVWSWIWTRRARGRLRHG